MSGAKGIFNILLFHFKFFHSAEFAKMITNYENILHFSNKEQTWQIIFYQKKKKMGHHNLDPFAKT
jgi:hypothetical protein